MKRTLVAILILFSALFLLAPAAAAADCYLDEGSGVYVCDAREGEEIFAVPPYHEDSIYYYRSYAWMEDNAPFYDAPGGRVVEHASVGILYYTIEETATDAAGNTWYRVDDRWANAADMHRYSDSRFPGVELRGEPARPFGWVLYKFRPAHAPDAEPPEDADYIERYTFVEIYDAVEGEEGWVWYDIGDGRWVKQTFLSLADPKPRPEGVGPDEFWVEVDLYEQMVAAYEGDRIVFATPASTGLPGFETNEGLFRVYARHREWHMWGGDVGDDYYYLQDVPHTMFFDRDIALHGAYWHDNFGEVRSHGCVNLPPRGAEWIWHWSENAPDDTLHVWVHTSTPEYLVNHFDAPEMTAGRTGDAR